MKKLFALVICVLMVISCMAGCGGDSAYKEDENADVTIKWIWPWAEQADIGLVEEALNKELKNLLPHTKIDLMGDATMGDNWSLWMSGKKSFDIAMTGYANDLLTEILNDSYLSLDSLIADYAPNIQKEREEYFKELYLTGEYNGELYGIPNVQHFTKDTINILIPKYLEQYADIERIVKAGYTSGHTTEEMYKAIDDFLVKSTAGRKDGKKVTIDPTCLIHFLWRRGYIEIASGTGYDPLAEEFKVINLYETEEFKTAMQWAKKWYDEGYISKDILTTSIGDVSGGLLTATDGSRKDLDERNTKYEKSTAGEDCLSISINNPEFDCYATAVTGSSRSFMSIPYTAKNPVRAIKLLDLLRTEEGAPILNLITYGIEGVHYEKTGEKEIKAFDYLGQASSSSKYGICPWATGNMLNMYTVYPFDSSYTEYAREFYFEYVPSRKHTELYGYSFDLTKLNSKISQATRITNEYYGQLAYGVASNQDGMYKEFLGKLKTAKIEEIISDLQKQGEKYISSNS